MKKLMLGLALITAFTVVSCKNENKKVENSEEVAVAEYQCPMKCEGDKTYTDKDVKCPVCGMNLKKVEKE
jgi:protein SCO1/2